MSWNRPCRAGTARERSGGLRERQSVKKSIRISGRRSEDSTSGSCSFLSSVFFCALLMGALSAEYHCLSDMLESWTVCEVPRVVCQLQHFTDQNFLAIRDANCANRRRSEGSVSGLS